MADEDLVSELDEFIDNKLEEALKIYEKEVFLNESSIFKELHKIMEDNEVDHNCIGCNLSEYATLIYSTLMLLDGYTSTEQKMNMFLMTLYLLVERIDTILGIIELHEGYRKENFKTLNKIRKWANFIKHPKAFILAHHPVYSLEGFKHNPDFTGEASININTPFIFNSIIKFLPKTCFKNVLPL